jgi:hypothetical protein
MIPIENPPSNCSKKCIYQAKAIMIPIQKTLSTKQIEHSFTNPFMYYNSAIQNPFGLKQLIVITKI